MNLAEELSDRVRFATTGEKIGIEPKGHKIASILCSLSDLENTAQEGDPIWPSVGIRGQRSGLPARVA